MMLIGIALSAIGIVIASPVILALGVTTAALGLVAWSLSNRKQAIGTDISELGAEARWLLRPIRELRDGLQKIAQDKSAATEVTVIAQEAVVEADAIYAKAFDLASAREGLKKSLKGRGEAETNLGSLERQLKLATTEGERTALDSAIRARQQELGAYDGAQKKIGEIDSRLSQATASLAEIKARLMTGAVHGGTLDGHQDEFNDMVVRLKSLGQSFDEAQDMLETKL